MQYLVNPGTGDAGLSPIIIVLAIVCTVIVVSGLVWMLIISKKKTDVTATDVTKLNQQAAEHTVVEPIEQPESNPAESGNDKTDLEP